MQNPRPHDNEFQRLQDALLQRIIISKHPQEREQLLSIHRRLLKQRRLKQVESWTNVVKIGSYL